MRDKAPPTPPVALPPFIPEAQFLAFLRTSEDAGVDTRRVLRDNGVEAKQPLSLPQFFRVERDIAKALDDLTAQLSERKLTYKSGAFVLDQLRQSRTLADAIEHLASYFNMLHGEHYNQVHRSAKTLTLRIDDTNFPYTLKSPLMVQFVGECVLITVHALLDSLSDGQAAKALRRVGLPHTPDYENSQHMRFWPVTITPALNTYELVYDHDVTMQPIMRPEGLDLSSEGMFSRVIAYLEAQTEAHHYKDFRTRTVELLKEGYLQQSHVAKKLGISVATLRRRLQDEQSSYRELAEMVRMQEARYLLEKGHSVASVTDHLDYSDIRSFNRAFKRWKGLTPAAYAQKYQHIEAV